MCKAWDDHKKRGIQEGRYLEIYSLVQDGIIEPELGAKRLNMPFADFERAMQKAGYKLPELYNKVNEKRNQRHRFLLYCNFIL